MNYIFICKNDAFLYPAYGVKTAKLSRFQDVTPGNVLGCYLKFQ